MVDLYPYFNSVYISIIQLCFWMWMYWRVDPSKVHTWWRLHNPRPNIIKKRLVIKYFTGFFVFYVFYSLSLSSSVFFLPLPWLTFLLSSPPPPPTALPPISRLIIYLPLFGCPCFYLSVTLCSLKSHLSSLAHWHTFLNWWPTFTTPGFHHVNSSLPLSYPPLSLWVSHSHPLSLSHAVAGIQSLLVCFLFQMKPPYFLCVFPILVDEIFSLSFFLSMCALYINTHTHIRLCNSFMRRDMH